MGPEWVRLAATDLGMLAMIFLCASRSLDRLQGKPLYAEAALRYKGDCMRSVQEAISREGKDLSDTTVAKCLALASDAVRYPGDMPKTKVSEFS